MFEATIEDDWRRLRELNEDVWAHHGTGVSFRAKLREAVELMPSVLWHLELADAVGPIVTECAASFRKRKYKDESQRALPWQKWIRERQSISVDADDSALTITYGFKTGPDEALLYAIQATMLGDAAVRLDAIRQALIDAAESERSGAAAELRKDSLFALDDTLEKRLAEIEDGPPVDSKALKNINERFSPYQIFEACLDVWDALYEALPRQVKSNV